MCRRLLLLTVVLTLVLAAPAGAYMHAANCLEGLAGANGDNEIAQTYPFDVAGDWQVDQLALSRAGEHHVVWSWRWAAPTGGAFWFDGECVGDDSAYVDRLLTPDGAL